MDSGVVKTNYLLGIACRPGSQQKVTLTSGLVCTLNSAALKRTAHKAHAESTRPQHPPALLRPAVCRFSGARALAASADPLSSILADHSIVDRPLPCRGSSLLPCWNPFLLGARPLSWPYRSAHPFTSLTKARPPSGSHLSTSINRLHPNLLSSSHFSPARTLQHYNTATPSTRPNITGIDQDSALLLARILHDSISLPPAALHIHSPGLESRHLQAAV